MKIRLLVFTLFGLGLTCAAWADDYRDLVTKGYRWVTVNGPYACTTEQELRLVTGDPTDAAELQMVEAGAAKRAVGERPDSCLRDHNEAARQDG